MSFGFIPVAAANAAEAALPGSLPGNPRLSCWLRFSRDGQVTVSPGKVEIGQGIITALAQIAADELDVMPARVRMSAAATPDSPNEGITSGSLSMQESGVAIRQACAEARAIHLSVAAQRSGVPVEALRVVDGDFLAPDGRRVGSYWVQADDRLLETNARGNAAPKPPEARRVAGSSVPRLDLPDKVFGAPRFLHDMRLPGMLHARAVRPPARAATLLEVRDGPLPAGTTLLRDGNLLLVVAPDEVSADAAAARVGARARWEVRESLPDEGALPAWIEATPAEGSEVARRDDQSPPDAHMVSARFTRPFLAHASIGPSCAIARWTGDTVEIWTHSQGIYHLRADLSIVLGIPAEDIVVRHVEGPGCYGHNGADDVALDAALAARAHPGQPVRMRWSRAEELAWSPHSPASIATIEAAVDADGKLTRWHCVLRGNGHSSRPGRSKEPTLLSAVDLERPLPRPVAINAPAAAGGGAQRNAVPSYRVPKLEVTMHRLLEMPIRTSALRGLGALLNGWAIEAVMDELAEQSGQDPIAFRLRHLDDDPRAAAVLREAAAMCDWPRAGSEDGIGTGIGVARYKGTGAWCAVAAEVEAAEVVRVRRLWIAADIGEVINPDGALNQIEGGAVQACSIALKEAVHFDRLNVTSDSWDTYPILRFSEVPAIETHLIARPEAPPVGAGEASMGPTIAAIAGAIYAALGVRPRAMPFTPENLAATMEA